MDISLLITNFYELFSLAGLGALITIILIDITMSGDNAIIIGMATKNLPKEQRKKAILVGIFLATILRIIFAFLVTLLMGIVGIKVAGGLLLMYVVWKFYKEVRMGETKNESGNKASKTTFLSAISLIVMADISMSLDNVLAVAGAANENLFALGLGLIVSIVLMAIASNYIADKLEKYPQIQWVGLLVILYVALEMIMDGGTDFTKEFLPGSIEFSKSFMPLVIFLIGVFGFVLHDKYITPIEKIKIQEFIGKNFVWVIILNLLLIFFMGYWGDMIKNFLFSHISILYTFTFIMFFMIIEILAIYKTKR
nr:YjbE family putative metal transport protein [Candidatus Gracilibacteria bacterium]